MKMIKFPKKNFKLNHCLPETYKAWYYMSCFLSLIVYSSIHCTLSVNTSGAQDNVRSSVRKWTWRVNTLFFLKKRKSLKNSDLIDDGCKHSWMDSNSFLTFRDGTKNYSFCHMAYRIEKLCLKSIKQYIGE